MMVYQRVHLVGEVIGKYHILELLGEGAMGSVYRALDIENSQNVALKIPDPRFLEKSDFGRLFLREAQAMSLLRHPGIARIYTFVEHEQMPLLVMEYVEGNSLANVLARQECIALNEAIGYGLQICDAIGYAHGRGVIHRDLKPSNILITPHGAIKLVDFGISKILSGGVHQETLTFVGTPLYMSPEQCGEGVLDLRTDIYSIGVILYEMLLGKPPFTGDSPAEIIRAHLLDTPKFPKDGSRQVPGKIIKIIRKMLAKEPDDRYATAEDVAADLHLYQEKQTRALAKRAGPSPRILCHVPQQTLEQAVVSALNSTACNYEIVAQAGDLLSQVEQTSVDAVILGAEPGDGKVFTIAKQVREKTRNSRLQVILLNTGISKGDVQKAFQSGISRIIAEPYNPSVLVSKLEAIFPAAESAIESRRFFRKTISGTVRIHIESEIADISEGGMRILTNIPLKTGEIVKFDSDVLHPLGIGERSGKVVWIANSEETDPFLYQAGIDFIAFSDMERMRLRKWILRR